MARDDMKNLGLEFDEGKGEASLRQEEEPAKKGGQELKSAT